MVKGSVFGAIPKRKKPEPVPPTLPVNVFFVIEVHGASQTVCDVYAKEDHAFTRASALLEARILEVCGYLQAYADKMREIQRLPRVERLHWLNKLAQDVELEIRFTVQKRPLRLYAVETS
jgi:hypothetical protein